MTELRLDGLSTASSTPVTVTVCGWFQFPLVNVNVAVAPAVPPLFFTVAAPGVPDVTVTVTS